MPYSDEIFENQDRHREMAVEMFIQEGHPKKSAELIVGKMTNDEVTDKIGIPRSRAYSNY